MSMSFDPKVIPSSSIFQLNFEPVQRLQDAQNLPLQISQDPFEKKYDSLLQEEKKIQEKYGNSPRYFGRVTLSTRQKACAGFQEQYDALISKISALQEEINASAPEVDAKAKDLLSKLTDMCTRMDSLLTDFQNELKRCEIVVESLKEDYDQLNDRLTTMEAEYDRAQDIFNRLEKECSECENQILVLQGKINTRPLELPHLTSKLEEMQDRLNATRVKLGKEAAPLETDTPLSLEVKDEAIKELYLLEKYEEIKGAWIAMSANYEDTKTQWSLLSPSTSSLQYFNQALNKEWINIYTKICALQGEIYQTDFKANIGPELKEIQRNLTSLLKEFNKIDFLKPDTEKIRENNKADKTDQNPVATNPVSSLSEVQNAFVETTTCRICVKYNPGSTGNTIYVRGTAKGMSWAEEGGLMLKRLDANTYYLDIKIRKDAPSEIKFLENNNNDGWEKGFNHKIIPETKELTITPVF
jgi:DNA repair exonuclease SbcCD ATPase subunit